MPRATKKKNVSAAAENEVKEVIEVKEVKETKEMKKKPAVRKASTRKTASRTKSAAKKVKTEIAKTVNNYPNAYLVIDYPIEMETIYGNRYVVRVGASTDGYVEISFNDGEWQPCRYASGYWWFDWTYFAQGDYSIKVRLMDSNGNKILETAPRNCRIC